MCCADVATVSSNTIEVASEATGYCVDVARGLLNMLSETQTSAALSDYLCVHLAHTSIQQLLNSKILNYFTNRKVISYFVNIFYCFRLDYTQTILYLVKFLLKLFNQIDRQSMSLKISFLLVCNIQKMIRIYHNS